MVDQSLFLQNREIQMRLWKVALKYQELRDARWMFAFAHFRITQQINDGIQQQLFRNPDQLIRFNVSFATAFLAAVAGMTTAPWRKAFELCEGAVTAVIYSLPGCQLFPTPTEACRIAASLDTEPIVICSMAMASAHINTDVSNALKKIGCIDKNDYGNMLLLVERGARDAIYLLTGNVIGPMVNALKRTLLPLDKTWRNAIYKDVCGTPVPGIELSFRNAVERNSKAMINIRPSLQ